MPREPSSGLSSTLKFSSGHSLIAQHSSLDLTLYAFCQNRLKANERQGYKSPASPGQPVTASRFSKVTACCLSILAYYMDISPATLATYPIITVQSAWKAVSAGNGIISNITAKDSDAFKSPVPVALSRILINQVYLAYYETPEFQKYMQPIFVFEGKYIGQDRNTGNISIYYPAITAEFVK